MTARTTLTAAAVALLCAIATPSARADTRRSSVQLKQVNTAPRLILCSRNVETCEGATSIRTGLVVIDLASTRVRRGPVALVGMFQASAQPKDGLLDSQVIFGAGPRVTLGRNWVQAGVGFAGARLERGPKTIPVSWALINQHAPAVLAGVGRHIEVLDMPFQISLDVGTSAGVLDDDQFGDVYQVTASVLATGL